MKGKLKEVSNNVINIQLPLMNEKRTYYIFQYVINKQINDDTPYIQRLNADKSRKHYLYLKYRHILF